MPLKAAVRASYILRVEGDLSPPLHPWPDLHLTNPEALHAGCGEHHRDNVPGCMRSGSDNEVLLEIAVTAEVRAAFERCEPPRQATASRAHHLARIATLHQLLIDALIAARRDYLDAGQALP